MQRLPLAADHLVDRVIAGLAQPWKMSAMADLSAPAAACCRSRRSSSDCPSSVETQIPAWAAARWAAPSPNWRSFSRAVEKVAFGEGAKLNQHGVALRQEVEVERCYRLRHYPSLLQCVRKAPAGRYVRPSKCRSIVATSVERDRMITCCFCVEKDVACRAPRGSRRRMFGAARAVLGWRCGRLRCG
jgi:hypothetical protein